MTKRKRNFIFGAGVLVLAIGVGAFVRSRPHDLLLIGVVDANEIIVTPTVQARLDSLWIEEGSEVKAGQPIATLLHGEPARPARAGVAERAADRRRGGERRVGGTGATGRSARRSRATGGRARA